MLNPQAKNICPLCGEPNQCALAINPDAKECWCEGEKFPEALIRFLPEDMIGVKCICRSCLEELKTRQAENRP